MLYTGQRFAELVFTPKTQRTNSLARITCAIAIGIILLPASQLHAQRQVLTLPSSFHFDGTNYVTMANSPALAPTSQVTISGWIKPDFSVTNVVDTILDKRDGCGFNRSYQLGLIKTYQSYTPGTIFFAASNANTDDLISTVPVPNDGQFHHVAGTYDGTTTKVFLDGVLVGQGTHTGPISTTTDPAVIGIQAGCGDPTYADIGQVRIFNYAVPDNQIMSEVAGFAVLNGGNSFVGNQNVAGVVAASSFVGNGSGLSNINPSNIASGTASINISGTAASAVSALSAANAVNSANLAGVAASNYARVDIGNSFTGNQSVTGNLSASGNLSTAGTTTMGGGTPIVSHLSQTSFITVPPIGPNNCATLFPVSFSGASDGDTTALGVKDALTSGGNLTYFAWVSVTNRITIKVCNPHGTTNNVLSGTIRIDLWKH